MKKNVLLGCLIASVSLLSCNSEIVHDKIKDNMYKSCMEKLNGQLGEKGEEYCKCSAEEIMKNRTTEEILKLEKDINEGKITMEQITEMVKPCVEKLQGDVYGNAKAPNSPYKTNFTKACADQLKGEYDDATVQKYCSCAADAVTDKLSLEELKQLDQNPEDEALNVKVQESIKGCLSDLEKSK